MIGNIVKQTSGSGGSSGGLHIIDDTVPYVGQDSQGFYYPALELYYELSEVNNINFISAFLATEFDNYNSGSSGSYYSSGSILLFEKEKDQNYFIDNTWSSGSQSIITYKRNFNTVYRTYTFASSGNSMQYAIYNNSNPWKIYFKMKNASKSSKDFKFRIYYC